MLHCNVMETLSASAPKPANDPPSKAKPGSMARGMAHWIHNNQNITRKNLLGYSTYQVIRGGAAAIPYGISMASTLGAMVGIERAANAWAKNPNAGALAKTIGPRIEQFAKFPAIRSSFQIATSFTLYRGTSKIMKWMHDSLFDPKDSEAKTAEKIANLPKATWGKIKENAPAGIASTPVAAFVLGFVNSTFAKPGADALKNAKGESIDWTYQNLREAKAVGRKGLLKEVITHPNAKFVEQAAINTLGYSLFFEMGDRLFKDRQIARGLWKGDKNSITGKTEEPLPKKHYGFFTDDPSLGRFVLRRMLPTAVSIGAYTAFKFRHSYMHLGDYKVNPGPILPQIPKLTKIETTAVLWFAMIPFVNEAWEKVYDKFFDTLEKKAQAKNAPPVEATPRAIATATATVSGAPLPRVAQAEIQGRAAQTPQPAPAL